MKASRIIAIGAVIAIIIVAATVASIYLRTPGPPPPPSSTKIKHIVIIMQENQAFDHFFGTFPGLASGFNLPMDVCLPTTEGVQYPCVSPFNMDSNSTFDQGVSLGHGGNLALNAYDNGKMDGFVRTQPPDAGRYA